MYRHGDLCIKRIKELPNGLKKVNHNVLAEGEVTGHAHTLLGEVGDKFQLYEDEKGTLYLSVTAPVEITHQEHGIHEIGEGVYVIEREREFDLFEEEIRKVRD